MTDLHLKTSRLDGTTLSSLFALRSGLLLLLACNAISCRPIQTTNNHVGVYVLERVAQDSLPTVLISTSDVEIQVLADTLRLRANGTGTETRVRVFRDKASSRELLSDRLNEEFAFQLIDSGFSLTYLCPASAVCDPPPHAIARPLTNGLILIPDGLRQRGPRIYRRLADRQR